MQHHGRFIKLSILPIVILLSACSTKPDPLCNRHHAEKSSSQCILPAPPITQKSLSEPQSIMEMATTPSNSQVQRTSSTPHIKDKGVSVSVIEEIRQQIKHERSRLQSPSSKPVVEKVTDGKSTFTVQLGVYQEESNRTRAIEQLGSEYTPVLFPVKSSLYGLASGTFNNRSDADEHARQLQAIGFTDAYVRSRP